MQMIFHRVTFSYDFRTKNILYTSTLFKYWNTIFCVKYSLNILCMYIYMCIYKTTVQEIKIHLCKEYIVHKIIGHHYSSAIKCLIQKPLWNKVWFCFLNTLDSFRIPWLKLVDVNKYNIDKNGNIIETSIIILMLLFCSICHLWKETSDFKN